MSWLFIFLGRVNCKCELPVPLAIVSSLKRHESPNGPKNMKHRAGASRARVLFYFYLFSRENPGGPSRVKESVIALKAIYDDDVGQ